MKFKEIAAYVPIRILAVIVIVTLVMLIWAPPVIAAIETSSCVWSRFKYEIRAEWRRWRDALRTAYRAFISGEKQ